MPCLKWLEYFGEQGKETEWCISPSRLLKPRGVPSYRRKRQEGIKGPTWQARLGEHLPRWPACQAQDGRAESEATAQRAGCGAPGGRTFPLSAKRHHKGRSRSPWKSGLINPLPESAEKRELSRGNPRAVRAPPVFHSCVTAAGGKPRVGRKFPGCQRCDSVFPPVTKGLQLAGGTQEAVKRCGERKVASPTARGDGLRFTG